MSSHLPEATALVVEVGGIGAETARLAAAFGMQVLGVDSRRRAAPPGVAELHKEEAITWKFAVRWFAQELNVQHYLGTDVAPDGEIIHVWGRDQARWLRELAALHATAPERTAAVGDSAGDTEMLCAAKLRFFVGNTLDPKLTSVVHLADADLRLVSERIIDAWAA